MTTQASSASLLDGTLAAIRPLDGAAVVDVGVAADLPAAAGLLSRKAAAAARVLRDMATFDSAGVSGEKA